MEKGLDREVYVDYFIERLFIVFNKILVVKLFHSIMFVKEQT